jgi:hypothetical protein
MLLSSISTNNADYGKRYVICHFFNSKINKIVFLAVAPVNNRDLMCLQPLSGVPTFLAFFSSRLPGINMTSLIRRVDGPMMRTPSATILKFATLWSCFLLSSILSAQTSASLWREQNGRRYFDGSILPIPLHSTGTGTYVLGGDLTKNELSDSIRFTVELIPPNNAELQSRIDNGQLISPEEMDLRYRPSLAAINSIIQWMTSQGFVAGLEPNNRQHLVVSGTRSLIQKVFRVTFVHVATSEGVVLAINSAPSMPTEYSGDISGITGLQPETRLLPSPLRAPLHQ